MDKEFGFTLVELLITIVVATVLLAAGVPAFKSFIKNNRVTAQTNDLVSAIQLARSEALKRGTDTVVCASNVPATCTGKATWADGWIVFSDINPSDGADPITGTGKCLDTEDCIISTSSGLTAGNTLTTTADSIRFHPTGLSGVGAEVEFKLKAKNCEKNQARMVTLTIQGHTLVSTVACSS